MTFSKLKDDVLLNLAQKNNLDMDRVCAAYLTVGDDIFMLLHILEGQTIDIPSKKRLSAANAHNIHFIEDDKLEYKDYEKYDCIEKDGKMWSVIAEEKKILNHWYIPVIESTEVI